MCSSLRSEFTLKAQILYIYSSTEYQLSFNIFLKEKVQRLELDLTTMVRFILILNLLETGEIWNFILKI